MNKNLKNSSKKTASGGMLMKAAGPGKRNIVIPISIPGKPKTKLDFKKLDQKER